MNIRIPFVRLIKIIIKALLEVEMAENVTLDIEELRVGMYVQDIILKNSQHKVKNKGKVNSERTIAMLKKQGVAQVVVELTDEQVAERENAKNNPPVEEVSIADEFERSCQIYDDASEKVKELLINSAMDKPLSPEAMNVLADEITQSVMRNENAITILTRIRTKQHYQWQHAINCGVLVCGFGLYIGLKEQTVKEMTLGALLHDIGNAKVPRDLLEKNEKLTSNEMDLIKKHVFWGIEMAKREGFSSPVIIDMLVNHHERMDGSGYPRGLDKSKLSKLSRMTAIVDVYDAMTGDRSYKKGELPGTVLRHLLQNQAQFDQELVQQFIKFIGVYPVGSLVTLSNEKLAIVTEGNRVEPLNPVVKAIFSLKLGQKITPADIDLSTSDLKIVGMAEADDYNLNMNHIIRTMFG